MEYSIRPFQNDERFNDIPDEFLVFKLKSPNMRAFTFNTMSLTRPKKKGKKHFDHFTTPLPMPDGWTDQQKEVSLTNSRNEAEHLLSYDSACWMTSICRKVHFDLREDAMMITLEDESVLECPMPVRESCDLQAYLLLVLDLLVEIWDIMESTHDPDILRCVLEDETQSMRQSLIKEHEANLFCKKRMLKLRIQRDCDDTSDNDTISDDEENVPHTDEDMSSCTEIADSDDDFPSTADCAFDFDCKVARIEEDLKAINNHFKSFFSQVHEVLTLPNLKQSLPPTYAIWKTQSMIESSMLAARQNSELLAQLLLDDVNERERFPEIMAWAALAANRCTPRQVLMDDEDELDQDYSLLTHGLLDSHGDIAYDFERLAMSSSSIASNRSGSSSPPSDTLSNSSDPFSDASEVDFDVSMQETESICSSPPSSVYEGPSAVDYVVREGLSLLPPVDFVSLKPLLTTDEYRKSLNIAKIITSNVKNRERLEKVLDELETSVRADAFQNERRVYKVPKKIRISHRVSAENQSTPGLPGRVEEEKPKKKSQKRKKTTLTRKPMTSRAYNRSLVAFAAEHIKLKRTLNDQSDVKFGKEGALLLWLSRSKRPNALRSLAQLRKDCEEFLKRRAELYQARQLQHEARQASEEFAGQRKRIGCLKREKSLAEISHINKEDDADYEADSETGPGPEGEADDVQDDCQSQSSICRDAFDSLMSDICGHSSELADLPESAYDSGFPDTEYDEDKENELPQPADEDKVIQHNI